MPAKLVQIRRGTTSEHSVFTGRQGEITVDLDKDTVVVHDGTLQAGHPLARENMSNVIGKVGIQQLNLTSSNETAGQILTTDGNGNLLFADNFSDVSTTAIGGDLTGTVGNAQIAVDVITTDTIVDDAITTNKLINDSVTAPKIANNAVTTAKINDRAITSSKLSSSGTLPAWDGSQLTNLPTGVATIPENSITDYHIGDHAIDTLQLNENAVSANKIANNAVTTDKLADDVVTTAKINDSAITTAKINDSAITTAKINDGAITDVKITSVDASKLTGTLPASISVGTILQCLSSVKSDVETTTSTTFVTPTDLSVDITPSSANSKFLVMWCFNANGNNAGSCMQIIRDSTPIAIGDASGNRIRSTANFHDSNDHGIQTMAGTYLDSPNTASQITYAIQWRSNGLTNYLNRSQIDNDSNDASRVISSLTIFEIE